MRRKTYLYEYQPYLPSMLKNHIQEGHSVSSFTGKYKIDVKSFSIWLKEVPEMRELNELYKKEYMHKKRRWY